MKTFGQLEIGDFLLKKETMFFCNYLISDITRRENSSCVTIKCHGHGAVLFKGTDTSYGLFHASEESAEAVLCQN